MVDKTVQDEPVKAAEVANPVPLNPEESDKTNPEASSASPDDRLTRSEVDALIRERMAEKDAEMAVVLASSRSLSGAIVPAHSDGPGYGNPQQSWSLAQQEASMRGEAWE